MRVEEPDVACLTGTVVGEMSILVGLRAVRGTYRNYTVNRLRGLRFE